MEASSAQGLGSSGLQVSEGEDGAEGGREECASLWRYLSVCLYLSQSCPKAMLPPGYSDWLVMSM